MDPLAVVWKLELLGTIPGRAPPPYLTDSAPVRPVFHPASSSPSVARSDPPPRRRDGRKRDRAAAARRSPAALTSMSKPTDYTCARQDFCLRSRSALPRRALSEQHGADPGHFPSLPASPRAGRG